MEKLLAPIFAELDRRHLSETAISQEAVGNPSALKNLRVRRGRGTRNHPIENLEAIANALGLEFYIGPKRESAPVTALSMAEQDEYIPVPLHEALLAAGTGAENGESIIDRLAFRRYWLKRINVTASAARLARVAGDSMMPTLFPGDLVMIDTASTIPPITKRSPQDRRRSPIYALAEGAGARIKRIERPSEDQLLLLSDNPDYAPELRTGCDLAELKIIGKVVWWGHTVKE